jgi:hypothetical protein
MMMEDVKVLQGIIVVLVWLGSLYGAFVFGRWWQRRRTEGLSKDEIINRGKETVKVISGDALVKARAEYEQAMTFAKKKAEEINILSRGGGG